MSDFDHEKFAEAVVDFQKALELDPADLVARQYLGATYTRQYKPGVDTPEMQAIADNAEAEFRRVLSLDSDKSIPLESLAGLAYSRAEGQKDQDTRFARLAESADWYRQLTTFDPNNTQGFCRLGVIAWSQVNPKRLEARIRAGMKAEDPGPLLNPAERLALRARYGPGIDEGMVYLDRALRLDPSNHDAMLYMNLLLRERADLQDTQTESAEDIRAAEDWVQRSLQKPTPPPQPPPVLPAPRRVRVAANVATANLLSNIPAAYPPLAVEAGVQGTVRFTVIIDREGHIIDAQLVSGHPLLVAAATDAVKQWQYRPTLLNGQPVEVVTQVDVDFQFQQ